MNHAQSYFFLFLTFLITAYVSALDKNSLHTLMESIKNNDYCAFKEKITAIKDLSCVEEIMLYDYAHSELDSIKNTPHRWQQSNNTLRLMFYLYGITKICSTILDSGNYRDSLVPQLLYALLTESKFVMYTECMLLVGNFAHDKLEDLNHRHAQALGILKTIENMQNDCPDFKTSQ
ncbi:MAG: hypothetical protein WA432_00280 [Candidatus Babeliaceae bacterium]